MQDEELIERLRVFAGRLDAVPDDTPDIAYLSVEMTHGEGRDVRDSINVLVDRLEALTQPVVGVGMREALSDATTEIVALREWIDQHVPHKLIASEDWGKLHRPLVTSGVLRNSRAALAASPSPVVNAGPHLADCPHPRCPIKLCDCPTDAPVVGDEGRQLDGHDLYELANQLGGYVDMGTPKELAALLLRGERVAAAMADEIVRLRAILSSTPVMSVSALVEAGWMPIEQAPRDDALVDLWVVSEARATGWRITDAWWCSAAQEWQSLEAEPGNCLGPNQIATHFRPLPEPPTLDPHSLDRAGMMQEVE